MLTVFRCAAALYLVSTALGLAYLYSRDENLAAMCQRCHLNFDRDDHTLKAAMNRRQKQVEAGQMELDL